MNEERLIKIIEELFTMEVSDNMKDASFFGKPFNIKARNFMLIFISIEKEFSIKFSDEVIENRKIITFNSLLREINNAVTKIGG